MTDTLPRSSASHESLVLLGVRVDNVTMRDALAWAAWALGQDGPGRQIATVNVEFLVAAHDNVEFRAALNACALNVPDSIGVNLAARIVGRKLVGRIAGIDLMVELCGLAAATGARPFLLGAGPGVASSAARALQARFPGLTIAGTHSGSPAIPEEDRIVDRIRSSRPDILFVAYGAPAQDLWLARNLARTGTRIGVGVGGSFDYISGLVPRAPSALRRLGLEWAYRLLKQPSRWRRMLSLPEGMLLAIHQRLSQGRAPLVLTAETGVPARLETSAAREDGQ